MTLHSLYEGVLQSQNGVRSQSFIYDHKNNVVFTVPILMKFLNDQDLRMQISFREFRPNKTADNENTVKSLFTRSSKLEYTRTWLNMFPFLLKWRSVRDDLYFRSM